MQRQILFAILAAVALGTSACEQFVTVTRVLPEVYDPGQADQDLASATNALVTMDAPDDIVCPVGFTRSGGIGTLSLAAPNNNVVDTDTELNQVFNASGHMKVVQEINRCGVTNVNIFGCAGSTFIVEDLRDNNNGSSQFASMGPLVAHEYGHTKGLPHRAVNNSNFVMNASIGPNSLRVSSAECMAYQAGSSPIQPAVPDLGEAEAAGAGPVSIQEFVRRFYPDTMPFAEAAQFGPEVVPALLTMLADSDERLHWPMIASVIGIVGGPERADDLIAFIERPRIGRLSRQEYDGVRAAIVALGYLVEGTGSTRALDYLMSASDPGAWNRKAGMRGWQMPRGGSWGERNQRLAVHAVMGLGLSGHPEAKLALEQWRTRLERRNGVGSAAQQTSMLGVVQQALDDQRQVSRAGLALYYSR